MERATFVRTFGQIYEDSPWVAERAYDAGLGQEHDTVEGLQRAFAEVMLAAPRARQLELIRAHPDLAGKAARAGDLTESSRREQRSAGLDQLSEEELEHLNALNAAYRSKFGFPFILAVSGMDRTEIIETFERRLSRRPDEEFAAALAEINLIALLRLRAL